MYAILEKLYDATTRIERCVFLAGALAAIDVFADDLDEFFDDEDIDVIESVFGDIPESIDIDGRGYGRAESIFEWLRDSGKLGFLVKFATPVMTPTGENSRSFSWGYYNTKWVYAKTIEEAVAKGLDWVETMRASEDAEAKAKAKEGGAA